MLLDGRAFFGKELPTASPTLHTTGRVQAEYRLIYERIADSSILSRYRPNHHTAVRATATQC